MIDICEKMTQIYEQSYDLLYAEEQFLDLLESDGEILHSYKEWCEEIGYSERKGFRSYIVNLENENIWETIYPNKEELEEYEFFS